MDNNEAQKEEILVLQSIYEEKEFLVDSMNPPCGRVAADIMLPHPFFILLKHESAFGENRSETSIDECFELEHLPPINLFFEFPTGYPSQTCPAFLLSCQWLDLDQLTKLCKQLESLWEESYGEVILFRWIQFLKEEVLEFFNISDSLDITELSKYKKNNFLNSLQEKVKSFGIRESSDSIYEISDSSFDGAFTALNPFQSIRPSTCGGSGLTDSRAILDLHNGKVLKSMLKDFDMRKKLEIFQNSLQICNVCFTEEKGSNFTIFRNCHHFFCTECVKTYFEVQIKDGNINSLFCLQEKCDSQADGTMVKTVVSRELFEKYDALLLSHTLDNMSDIAYCPRKDCQCPLLLDSCGKMGSCPACNFVFCPFCKMAYHGVAPCDFKSEQRRAIFEDFMSGDETKKGAIEKMYGKKVIKSLVENCLSETWMSMNSKNCPHCKAVIEKKDGCNKMVCFKCGTIFCWLCLKVLKTSNPYLHYGERGTECYERLFPEEYITDEFEIMPGEFLDL